MTLEVNKVITLGNDERYLIIEKINCNEKEYYYIAEVNQTETDIKDNYKIVTTNEVEGDLLIEEITGEDKLKEILPLLYHAQTQMQDPHGGIDNGQWTVDSRGRVSRPITSSLFTPRRGGCPHPPVGRVSLSQYIIVAPGDTFIQHSAFSIQHSAFSIQHSAFCILHLHRRD